MADEVPCRDVGRTHRSDRRRSDVVLPQQPPPPRQTLDLVEPPSLDISQAVSDPWVHSRCGLATFRSRAHRTRTSTRGSRSNTQIKRCPHSRSPCTRSSKGLVRTCVLGILCFLANRSIFYSSAVDASHRLGCRVRFINIPPASFPTKLGSVVLYWLASGSATTVEFGPRLSIKY